jgi:hypothetical protein
MILGVAGASENYTLENDGALKEVGKKIPPGWTISVERNRLVIARKDPVWVLLENRINAPGFPLESAADLDARIRKNGQQGTCRLVFRLEERWTKARWSEARLKNEGIEAAIAALPAKYGIVHLYDSALSRKGEPTYVGRSEEEKAKIAAYLKERQALQETLLPLPIYESTKWSLFFLEAEGREDEMHLVSPISASRELYGIEALLGDFCPAGK